MYVCVKLRRSDLCWRDGATERTLLDSLLHTHTHTLISRRGLYVVYVYTIQAL